jgi:hypothetical protein
MCTVTFVPAGEKIYITHNRDEKNLRARAIPPRQYFINGYTLLFPRDGQAGGTWIAANQNGAAAVLLNGAFNKHKHQPPYKKSRGLAFLDIVAANDVYVSYSNLDLANIEPFTVILWNRGDLLECRWDGRKKHIKTLAADKPHTWSSVTLYNAAVIEKREDWFEKWQAAHVEPALHDILQFHLSAGDGDTHHSLLMNREGLVLTVSITALAITPDKCEMKYLDTLNNNSYFQEMRFTKAGVIK